MVSQIDNIRRRKEVLDQQLKVLEAKKRLADKKATTRRRILLGALVQARMAQEPEFAEEVRGRLDAFLTRDIDRRVFDLGPASTRP